jgi:hypothetical protein
MRENELFATAAVVCRNRNGAQMKVDVYLHTLGAKIFAGVRNQSATLRGVLQVLNSNLI